MQYKFRPALILLGIFEFLQQDLTMITVELHPPFHQFVCEIVSPTSVATVASALR